MSVAYYPPLPLYLNGNLICGIFWQSVFRRNVPRKPPPRRRLDSGFGQVHKMEKKSCDGEELL
jgi:hypothetical protein